MGKHPLAMQLFAVSLLLVILIIPAGDIATGSALSATRTPTPVPWSDLPVITAGNASRLTRLAVWGVAQPLPAYYSLSRSGVTFSPDGKLVATYRERSSAIRVWDMKARRQVASLQGHEPYATDVVFSPDSKTLATADREGVLRIWDLQTALARIVIDAGITSLAFNPDGTLLAGGRWDQTVWLWDPRTGKQLATFAGSSLSTFTGGRTDSIFDLAFSLDGARLVAASLNSEVIGHKQDQQFSLGTALVWDVKTGNRLITFRGPQETRVLWAASKVDGELIVASVNREYTDDLLSGSDKVVYLWDARTGVERFALDHRQRVWYVLFNAKRTVLAVVTEYADLVFWDIETGRRLSTIVSLGNNFGAFSPDGSLFATPCGVWNVQTGDNLAKQLDEAICSPDVDILSMSFSPDGRLLAFLTLDSTIQLWGVH